jgi:serine phosphatase RsbU (regulator of sigma subunit)
VELHELQAERENLLRRIETYEQQLYEANQLLELRQRSIEHLENEQQKLRSRIAILEEQKVELARSVIERIKLAEAQANEIEALNNIVRVINEEIEFENVLMNLLDQGRRLIPQADSGAFLILDPQLDMFRIGAAYGYDIERLRHIRFSMEEARQRYSLPSEQRKDGVYIVHQVDRKRAGAQKVSDLPLPKAMLAMTLFMEGALAGFIIFDNFKDENAFDNSDLERMNRYRQHAIPAFAKANLVREIKLQSQELATMDHIVRVINQEIEFERLLGTLLEQAIKLIPKAQKGAFLIYNAERGAFEIVASLGYDRSLTAKISLTPDEAYRRYTVGSSQIRDGAYIIDPERIEESLNVKFKDLSTPMSMLAMTIMLGEELAGYLILDNQTTRFAFQESDVNRLIRFRDHAVSAYAKARYMSEIRQQNDKLEEAYQLIQKSNNDLMNANQLIEDYYTDVKDSIRYARRIQEAILPRRSEMTKYINDFFVLYVPKDIVSGDFYWFTFKDNKLWIAAADCTGHGVPGAFMSVMGTTLLNTIVNEQGISSPPHILNVLNFEVKRMLKSQEPTEHKADDPSSYDGMEIALCMINYENMTLYYAGANRPLFRVNGDIFEEVKGDTFPVGLTPIAHKTHDFVGHAFPIQKGDQFYLSTDGYQDQFGGEHERKFSQRKFKELLKQVSSCASEEQEGILQMVYEDWKGHHNQTDDILVIGLRFDELGPPKKLAHLD